MPPRAASFQNRTITADVAEAINTCHTTVLTFDRAALTSVLFGLGGVGKTQLALDYAETVWAACEVDLLVWITATSRDAIVAAYAHLATDLTGTEDPDPEHGAQRLLAWFGRQYGPLGQETGRVWGMISTMRRIKSPRWAVVALVVAAACLTWWLLVRTDLADRASVANVLALPASIISVVLALVALYPRRSPDDPRLRQSTLTGSGSR